MQYPLNIPHKFECHKQNQDGNIFLIPVLGGAIVSSLVIFIYIFRKRQQEASRTEDADVYHMKIMR